MSDSIEWGPWFYNANNQWIYRKVVDGDGSGEIWCEFGEPPDDEGIEWLLAQLNEAEK